MRSFFDFLTRMALRFRWFTLVIVTVVMILGGIATTELQQELLPPIEFPQSFVLIQVSGMTSDEVLNVVTLRVEDVVANVPGVVNVETQTSGSLGVFMFISTEFGIPQDEIRADIQATLNSVFFPNRAIVAPEGTDDTEFAMQLISDLTPDVMLYLAQSNPTFLFQLSPDVWASFSDETLETLLAYLASQDDTPQGETSALEQLVETDILPQLEALDLVASISIEGGQALPGEDVAGLQTVDASELSDNSSVLLQLNPDVWAIVSDRLELGELNTATAEQLATIEIASPDSPPELPSSWQTFDHYRNASDLLEMASFTRTIATVLNDFVNTGEIRGALGTTEDLSVEAVQTMLDIQPSLANYFDGEQLAAISPDVLEILQDYVDLDGISRDQLASSILAREITGDLQLPDPVVLPNPWRLSPPQIITFSFADLPLATFSIFSEISATPAPAENAEEIVEPNDDGQASDESDAFDPTTALTLSVNPAYEDVAEGPELPALYAFFGEQFNYELNTADDLLKLQFPDEIGTLLGSTDGVAFLNLLPQLNQFGDAFLGGGGDADDAAPIDPGTFATLAPALIECGIGIQDLITPDGGFSLDPLATGLINCLEPEVFAYLAENDPTFSNRLSPAVYANLSPEVYSVDGFAPLLGDVWSDLSQRPELADQSLRNADGLIALSDGSAAQLLNIINAEVTGQFVGYEIRLFDSLSPEVITYLAEREPDFFETLEHDVLLKFSSETLAALPQDALTSLPDDIVEQVEAIASGQADSAIAAIASQYTSDVAPPRPDAPPLNAEWQQIAGFYSVPLDNAYDIIRFEENLGGSPAQFMNNLFLSPNGRNFAPDLLGNMPVDVFYYIADEDETFIPSLSPRALNLFSEDVFEQLPEETQERARAGEVFVPSTQVTRTNGAPSLLVTIFKTAEANTVNAFADVEAIINTIDENNDTISVEVAFEQASFIEESISGVVLSGIMGAFFAIVNILVFLSGDTWGNGRRITGIIVTVLSVVLLIGFYFVQGQDFNAMISGEPVLVTALIIFGVLAGLLVLLYPGRLPFPAWRATLVIAVSIPLSILSALALMRWLPGIMDALLGNYADLALVAFILRLAPEGLTLNIMTLSGLTVAVGRLVDDSIVVLENIFRQLQDGTMEKREAILYATRDVSVAIFSATSIAVLVFLPLGLTGGLISEFFLPFGVAVTYTLLSSFVVAITVVPVLAYFLISADDVPAEEESWMERAYAPVLRWVLSDSVKPVIVFFLAIGSILISVYLFLQRPAAFLPDFGEPQLAISITMPEGTGIVETNERVLLVENTIRDVIPESDLTTLRTIVGGGGLDFSALLGGGGVTENIADVSVSVTSSDNFEQYVTELETALSSLFTGEDESVAVSAGTLSSGGFGGFELVVSGNPLADLDTAGLQSINADVLDTLNELPELENATSNLPVTDDAGDDTQPTYIRVCSDDGCSPAIVFTGELNTDDTINFATTAIEAIQANVELPEGVNVGQGFDTELQTEGFSSIFVAMGIASVMIVAILIIVFRSPLYWFAVFLSVIVAPIGAAIALTITDRVLGISSLIGLLMLLGLVVTNAIVLIDRVGSNRTERGMSLYDALVEGGRRRLRPIIMTALTTIIGLIPLALGVSEGAIIAAELGTVVIGGVISSTLLMLIVVPSSYYLLARFNDWVLKTVGVSTNAPTDESSEKEK
ncbi:MAG: efflux RND transporter permease subunit [Anaerolineae bacterium]